MAITINLLGQAPPGRARVELTLRLRAAEFEKRDVPLLRESLAKYLDVSENAVRVVSVTRWKPIVELEVSEDEARRLQKAFESGEAAFRVTLDRLAPEALNVHLPATPSTATSAESLPTPQDVPLETVPWTRLVPMALYALVVITALAVGVALIVWALHSPQAKLALWGLAGLATPFALFLGLTAALRAQLRRSLERETA